MSNWENSNPNTGPNPWTAFFGGGNPDLAPSQQTTGGAPLSGGPGGGGGNQPASASVNGNGFDPQNIIKGADGHYYAFKRSIGANGVYGYETVDIGDGTDINAMAALTGIPAGLLPNLLQEANNQAAKVKAGSYGKILGFGTDGTVIVSAPDGTIQRVTPAQAATMGIQPEEILQAKAALGQVQKTLTMMGQYTVVGMSADGVLTVKDFYGNLSTATADKLPPGVSLSQFQEAQANYLQTQKTLTQSGNWKVVGTDKNGNVIVEDYFGNQKSVSVDAQGNVTDPDTGRPLKGITGSEVQQAVQRQTELNFNDQTVGALLGGAVPGQLPGGAGAPPPPPGGGGPPPPHGTDAAATPATPSAGAMQPTQAAPASSPYTPPSYMAPAAPAGAPGGAPASSPSYTAPPPYPTGGGGTATAGGTGAQNSQTQAASSLNAQYQAAASQYNGPGSALGGTDAALTPTGTGTGTEHGAAPQYNATGTGGALGGGDAAMAPTAPDTGHGPAPPAPGAPPPPPTPGGGPTGGVNNLTRQQLALANQARQDYYNYGKTMQNQQIAALAGQSRSGQGTGFSSIGQRQTMAGQQ